ncbi:MAG: hypothetical protein QF733_09020 [Phycisphaerales bacterium]|nr:hypothetical protein [Phycisphaerales bacterium]
MAVVLAGGMLVGCGGAAKGPAIAPDVDMFRSTEDGRMARYDVSAAGQLRFAGGYDARDGIWSWTGSIDASQGAALSRVVREAGWVASPPATGPGTDTWEIVVKTAEGRRRFEVTGDPPSVLQAWALLDRAGQARLQQDLDLLPTPDIDALVKRRHAEQQGSSP